LITSRVGNATSSVFTSIWKYRSGKVLRTVSSFGIGWFSNSLNLSISDESRELKIIFFPSNLKNVSSWKIYGIPSEDNWTSVSMNLQPMFFE